MTQTLMSPAQRSALTTVSVHAADPVTRAGIVGQLRRSWDLEVVEQRGRPAALALVVADSVDDATVRRVQELSATHSAVVLVLAKLDARAVLPMLGHGVRAVLTRWEATADRLLAVLRSVSNGGVELPPSVLRLLLDTAGFGRQAAQRPRLHVAALSPREREVLTLVADGLSTREVAARMAYSERTIKNILQELTARLHLANRTQAVAYALRNGWI
jgi:DNA-binding NarL/FixJ family response regulator